LKEKEVHFASSFFVKKKDIKAKSRFGIQMAMYGLKRLLLAIS
jgi:hypothetical protein